MSDAQDGCWFDESFPVRSRAGWPVRTLQAPVLGSIAYATAARHVVAPGEVQLCNELTTAGVVRRLSTMRRCARRGMFE
jgi:hypothetical protein